MCNRETRLIETAYDCPELYFQRSRAFWSAARDRYGRVAKNIITNSRLSVSNTSFNTIHEGMLEGRCARIPQKSTSSAWSAAAVRADDVDLNMDLIEGRVRYRKGKKVRLAFELKIALSEANQGCFDCSGRRDGLSCEGWILPQV